MPANLADFSRNALFGPTANSAGASMPATLWCQLHTANPTGSGTVGIAATTTRISFTRTLASAGVCSNEADIIWPTVASNQVITHISAWSANSAGNCWWQGQLTTQADAVVGTPLKIPAGDLDLKLE